MGNLSKASFRTIDHLGQSRPLQGVLGWEEGKGALWVLGIEYLALAMGNITWFYPLAAPWGGRYFSHFAEEEAEA